MQIPETYPSNFDRPPKRVIVSIPYSSNAGVDRDGDIVPYPSILSEIAFDAALTLRRSDPDNSGLLIVGERGFGDNYPSTAQLLARSALASQIEPIIDLNSLVVADKLSGAGPIIGLNNTPFQISYIYDFAKRLQAQSPDTTFTLVPLSYHAIRLARYAKSYGLTAEYVNAEAVLEENGRLNEYKPYLDALTKAIENGELRSEKLLTGLTFIDRRGRFPMIATHWIGARVMDIVKETDDDGRTRYVFINTFSAQLWQQKVSELD